MEKKYYTGVGARSTPQEILSIMTTIAQRLEHDGWVLRSGGAVGADTAFETGVGMGKKEIYTIHQSNKQAEEIAAAYHPAWDKCGDYVKKLHARNAFQVLGLDLKTPSTFLICWTEDACTNHNTRTRKTGGTGTAISIANGNGVPVYNLANKDHFKTLMDYLGSDIEPKPLEMYTAGYGYGGSDRLDITVKGNHPIGKYFAPTWEMVQNLKNGSLSENDYILAYYKILDWVYKNHPEIVQKVYEMETVTFVCFCKKENFCHRHLLARSFESGGHIYNGERT